LEESGNAIQLQGSWLNYFSNFLPSASYLQGAISNSLIVH